MFEACMSHMPYLSRNLDTCAALHLATYSSMLMLPERVTALAGPPWTCSDALLQQAALRYACAAAADLQCRSA